MKKGSKYFVRNIKYKYYLSEWILECENTKSYHLNHKTLKLFKPKFLTLSIRSIKMLIDFEICKIWSKDIHSNIIPQFDYISKIISYYKKNNDTRFDPRAPFYPSFSYMRVYTYIHILHMHIHTYMVLLLFLLLFLLLLSLLLLLLYCLLFFTKQIF